VEVTNVSEERTAYIFRIERGSQTRTGRSRQQLCLHLSGCVPCLFFEPVDGDSTFFRNVGKRLSDYTTSHPWRWYCHVVCMWLYTGFWIIGFMDHLQVVTTNDYNTRWFPHFKEITPTHAKTFPACGVFNRRFLVTAFNNDYSSTSVLKSSLNGCFLPTELFLLQFVSLWPLHGPTRKDSFQQYLYCCMRIHCCGNVFTEPLPGNGSSIFAYLTAVAW
jgi:hypothetical protein